jgi:hypothetical protein
MFRSTNHLFEVLASNVVEVLYHIIKDRWGIGNLIVRDPFKIMFVLQS